MSWFDNQEAVGSGGDKVKGNGEPKIEIQLPGADAWVRVNKNQVRRIYEDDIGPRLLIIVDEVAELLTPSGVKTEEAKEEDAMRNECAGIIQSITQLGRSAGIHMILCTQRNDAKIISGVTQNNPLSITTKINIRRKYGVNNK